MLGVVLLTLGFVHVPHVLALGPIDISPLSPIDIGWPR